MDYFGNFLNVGKPLQEEKQTNDEEEVDEQNKVE
jgi:hypothetical protein